MCIVHADYLLLIPAMDHAFLFTMLSNSGQSLRLFISVPALIKFMSINRSESTPAILCGFLDMILFSSLTGGFKFRPLSVVR